ncbi:hypothetical protein BC828DRAFT_395341 [Blastocladiella britannica]|nr:hypothetical protein BC828DRAFT_395341 [Blastocladiella britannica]
MTTTLDRNFLASTQAWIRQNAYTPSPAEKQCLDAYTVNTLATGAATLGLFAFFGTKLVLPEALALAKIPPAAPKPGVIARASTATPSAAVKASKAAAAAASALPKGSWFNLGMSLAAVSGTAFIATYYSARWAGAECVACLLKTKGGDQKLGDLMADMMAQYRHPQARAYLEATGRPVPTDLSVVADVDRK